MTIIDTTKDISALFKQQVKAAPDALALEDDSFRYTYAELDRKVESLARRLRRHGVTRDVLVGVLLPRSAYYVIACLAALRAGGAFLVLELAYPPDLLADVLSDAKPAVVVTLKSEAAKAQSSNVPQIILDESSTESENGVDEDIKPAVSEDDLEKLCFVSYSSGTTGKPKGIANCHRAPVLSYNIRFGLQDVQPGDRVACNVFFIWEMLRPLLRGATVVAVPDDTSYDPAALVDLLENKNITETLMTPTLLATVLSRHHDIGERLPNLRTLWLNGEVVTSDLARRAMRLLPKTRLLNCYSASETHEIACGDIREMLRDDDAYCPVGPSFVPDYTYILNEQGEKVEEGVSGELFVGGPMLARGYLNLPEQTAKAFVPNPFVAESGQRMYRTGDTARRLPSGVLEITGRVGEMIKLRGYSVVPGKVENAIMKHLAVSHCAVIAHGDGLERQLVAYIVRDRDASNDDRPVVDINTSGYSPAARRTLAPYLAHYMIPALWVELDFLPTHGVSGKVDLKNLPPPRSRSPIETEEKDPISLSDIAGVWAATLKTAKSVLKAEDNFFDLGGHSLSLAELSSRLLNKFQFRVPIARLADNPTLAGHLKTVRDIRDGHVAEVQADLPAVLRADAKLDESVVPIEGTKYKSIKDAKNVLLTGVTGFLGPFLLNEILTTTDAHVICLVRFNEPEDDDQPGGVARIRRNLLDMGIWRDSIMERIEILPGNLSRPKFGLTSSAFDELAQRIDLIVHAAATVNLVYSYAALQKPNVGGTREILHLACKAGATVQYVSTNGVLPASTEQKGWDENVCLPVDDVPTKLADGYGQTKWVAEQLVLEASRRGLPVMIHRAGTISGHSVNGAANAWDLLSALIVESIKLKYAPDVENWRAEMTPVDYVSRAIIHLASKPEKPQQTIFHLGDSNPVQMRSVFADLKKLGYPTEPLGWNEWVALWTEKRGSVKGGDGAFTVDILRSGMPTVDFLCGIVVLDDTATREHLKDVARPSVNAHLLETYTRHWFARGWLAKAPLRQAPPPAKGILSGRVAVITGASSGIGAAVATLLAREGCHVALAARRVASLEAVKSKLNAPEGTKVLIKSTDVTKKDQVDALFKAATAELGPVDILVSCAGVMYYTLMANTKMDEWEQTVDVNCKGLLHCLSASVPDMLARHKGHIVAISSDAGRKVFPGLGVYSASKFFVEATLQALRLETAGSGLRVTAVQPGNTQTDLLTMSTDQEAVEKYGGPSESQILDPMDVAKAIVYALQQPEHVAMNEILIEPRDEPI
ncbi:AMP-dependent synthetase/ligase [Ascosphaera apis ARSEF 7405]|uniref:AMP-dependent synthetase/ligase n=1 Tax=Ascosphaera apis ARSEF 7405 TaxID=392613 RepID=A0A167WPR6_9EURO|nr:AMP-dependent synthetase/ligase [Ascosphaera apis ARSEF 7405]